MKKIIYNKLQVTKNKPQKQKTKKIDLPQQPYLIVWRDAYTSPDEWYTEDQKPENTDYIVYTTGYITSTTKDYYTVAATITQESVYCSVINIPKKMVVSKQKLAITDK